MSEIDAVAASTGGIEATRARIAQLQLLLTGGPAAASSTAGTTSGRRVGSLGVGGRLGANLSADETFDSVLGQVDGTAGLDKSRAVALLDAASSASGLSGLSGLDGAALGDRAVSIARRYLGVPYKWGGTDPDKGLDCSGLTQLVFDQVGVDLPRTSQAQAKSGREIASVDDARPGDLVFFDSPVHHVGIYIGDGKILHAPHTGDVVKISKIWEKPSHIRRVLPEGGAAGSAGITLASLLGSGSVKSLAAAGSSGVSGPYAALFARAGKQYGVDPALLSAVAKAESGYRPGAVSRAGARGLMQIMPSTARGLGIDPDVPEQAVDGAARLLSGYLKQYDGRTDLALAAYNAGPGAVRKYGGVPPYAETRTYVQRVTGYWNDLR